MLRESHFDKFNIKLEQKCSVINCISESGYTTTSWYLSAFNGEIKNKNKKRTNKRHLD